MSRWTAKTTPEQRAACIRALVDDEISAPKVVEFARAGKLYDLEPFAISPSACRRLRAGERERRSKAALLEPAKQEDTLNEARTRCIALTLVVVDEIEAGQKPSKNLSHLRSAIRCLNDLQFGLRAGRQRDALTRAKKETQQAGQEHPTQPSALVQRLTAAAKPTLAEQHGDDDTPPDPPPDPGSSARVVSLPARPVPPAA